MAEPLQFDSRIEFRNWLKDNCTMDEGIWLLFAKFGEPKIFKANEALEEALCFGWIDGQIKKVDESSYIKYFSQRRKKSKWSDKNKGIVQDLEKQGLMTDYGRVKIEEAKKNGHWDAPNPLVVTEKDIRFLENLLEKHEIAYTNFTAMSFSVKKTYTRAYMDAKTDDGRTKRLLWMIDRLDNNWKPM